MCSAHRSPAANLLRFTGVVLFCATTAVWAKSQKQPEISPNELVREAVAHEVASANSPAKHIFVSRKQTPRGSQTRLYVETTDAMAGMLIANDDQPLSAEQQQAEMDHLRWLEQSPDQLRKKHTREKEDADRSLRILKALPDAFRYEYAGTEPGSASMGKEGHELARLTFTPNPNYSPPTRVEQVLAGMQGYVCVDLDERRIAKIDGTLFRDVGFGWGLIGHLDKGGHFLVQQADVGGGSWEITTMSLRMTGKILIFKSISMSSDEVLTDFARVPDDLTFAKGVELLKAERDKLAHLHAPAAAEAQKTRQ